jgi:hypothetical protein
MLEYSKYSKFSKNTNTVPPSTVSTVAHYACLRTLGTKMSNDMFWYLTLKRSCISH